MRWVKIAKQLAMRCFSSVFPSDVVTCSVSQRSVCRFYDQAWHCNSVIFIEVSITFASFSFQGYEFYADTGMGLDDFRR